MFTEKANALCILAILKEDSDENHILGMKDIIGKMATVYGLKVDRRTVYSAIALLNDLDYDISTYEENGKGYFLRARTFEISEVRMLMDAVYGFPYIPPKQTADLIKKIQQLLSVHERKNYRNLTVVRQERKSQNKEVFLNIEILDEAIANKHKVSFTYLNYDFNKKLVPQRQEPYVVNPYGMVCENEQYYLIGTSKRYKDPALFRVDLMKSVAICEEKIELSAKEVNLDSVKNITYAFSGEQEEIDLRCDDGILKYVLERFGTNIQIRANKDDTFNAVFKASPEGVQFWALQYLPYVEVLKPITLRKAVIESIKTNKYKV